MLFQESKYSLVELVEMTMEIKKKYPSPAVAIIGATDPGAGYERSDGVQLGENLAKHMKNGVLFTGGVNGVGVDAYTGYLRAQLSAIQAGGPIPVSRFFILIPERERYGFKKNWYWAPFPVVEAYGALSRLAGVDLAVERVGDSLDDRRKCLAILSDVCVMANGSDGTLDEAINALRLKKPVITVRTSGGAAFDLACLKMGIDIRGVSVEQRTWIPNDLNLDLIHIVQSMDEVFDVLQRIG